MNAQGETWTAESALKDCIAYHDGISGELQPALKQALAIVRLHPELSRNAARYEIVRKLNPRDFLKLWNNCMHNDVKFDDAVDKLARAHALGEER